MMRFTLRPLAMGAYSLFMREQKSNPKLQGLPISKRGKMLATLYRDLSPVDKTSLMKRAAALPTPVRKTKVNTDDKPKVKRQPSRYAKFVKANIHKFDKLPRLERMKAVARLWNMQKK